MIRAITWEDFPRVLELAEEFVDQLDYDEPFNTEHAENVLEASAEQGLAFVLEEEERVVGAILALTSVLPWSDVVIAQEVMFYITPDARGGGHGSRMLEALEDGCRERDIEYLAMISMSSLPVVQSVYQKAGFEEVERVWRKRI